MPGRIQTIERAAAVLGLLGASPEPLGLAELSDALGIARPTLHGILATLVDVGFVHQDRDTRRYEVGDGLRTLQQRGVDRHDLRSRSIGWCDTLASRLGAEVVICVPDTGTAEVVHHVFRPDSSPQQRRLGERLPLHATGAGKVLLATSPAAGRHTLDLVRYTARTATTRIRLQREIERVRGAGWGAGHAEYQPDRGDVAAPIRGVGGIAMGALACIGPLDDLFGAQGLPRGAVVDGVRRTAAAISDAMSSPR